MSNATTQATAIDPMKEVFGEVIHSYSRADALADGELVDVSKAGRDAGLRLPTVVTRAVWDRYCEFDARSAGQCLAGRVWDVVWMLRLAIARGNKDESQLAYSLFVAIPVGVEYQSNERRLGAGDDLPATHREVTLKVIVGPGDTAEPVLTILMPWED